MLKHRHIDIVCIAAAALAVVLTLLFMNGAALGIRPASSVPGYVTRLFDSSRVHTIDLQVEDWGAFIEAAPEEEYISCTVEIDGESFYQVGLRAKGNNSRRLTNDYGLSRYSMKLEFDHYQGGASYHGLDKLSLDASFQDNSYLKTFLTYDMMAYLGVPTPLCSYAWVTVNGTPWGLFLAVEEPEEAFLRRNFGSGYGRLYKPDYRLLQEENADVDLRYVDDDPASYDNIFRNARVDYTEADQQRLIQSLKILSSGEGLETAVDLDEVTRYFAAQVFVLNLDSYTGPTGHNYFLYEEDGVLSILPWDYNLAFGTYCLGMTDPIRDPNVLINYPVDTPWEGSVMLDRPLFHQVMKYGACFAQYHWYLQQICWDYVEGGRCELTIRQTMQMIAPYVEADPTAFCSYEDHLLAAETLLDVCELRAESILGQLAGAYPSTLRERSEWDVAAVDASQLDLQALGDFDDLRNAKERNDAALAAASQ